MGDCQVVQGICSQPAADRFLRHTIAMTETHDAVTHSRCITGWRGVYEHVGRQPFHGEVNELWLRSIQIFRERLDQPCAWRGSAWSGAILFVALAASRGKVSCDGCEVTPSAITIIPGDLLKSAFCSTSSDNFTIAVQERTLVDYAEKVLGRVIPQESLHRCFVISDAKTVDAFQRCAAEVLGEAASRPDLLENEFNCIALRERVLDMLVRVIEESAATARSLSPSSTRCFIVEKATRYMDSHLADPLVMSDVAGALRVSPRTLRYSFKEIVGVAPSDYFLAMRLERVRRSLLQANSDSRIHCIAERYGFAHMGRFAQFYHSAFGEYPTDTRRRAGIRSRFASRSLARC